MSLCGIDKFVLIFADAITTTKRGETQKGLRMVQVLLSLLDDSTFKVLYGLYVRCIWGGSFTSFDAIFHGPI